MGQLLDFRYQLFCSNLFMDRHLGSRIRYLTRSLVSYCIGSIARCNLFMPPSVLLRMPLRIHNHSINFVAR